MYIVVVRRIPLHNWLQIHAYIGPDTYDDFVHNWPPTMMRSGLYENVCVCRLSSRAVYIWRFDMGRAGRSDLEYLCVGAKAIAVLYIYGGAQTVTWARPNANSRIRVTGLLAYSRGRTAG